MDAVEFKGFFYKILLETPFNKQIINIKISDDDFKNWTISDYLYHHFGLKIIYTMTCIYFRQNNSPNILED